MATICRDTPCLSITSVARDRLPVFRTDAIKKVVCAALDEARHSGGFALFAYVVMPDHLHIITDGARKASDTLRFVNGITSHRVIGYLKENNYRTSLAKLKDTKKARGHEYSLWDGHSNLLLVISENVFMQRVNYMSIRIRCERGWLLARRITDGQALAAGAAAHWRTSPC